MTFSEYVHLKNQISFAVSSSSQMEHLLHSLKQMFHEHVNSRRRFEEITSISKLLQILELRNVLSEDNVEPLKLIAKQLQIQTSHELLNKIAEYELYHEPSEHVNYYAAEERKCMNNSQMHPTLFNPNIMSRTKYDLIKSTLINEIGLYWRDLARNLKIREHFITKIDRDPGNKTLNKAEKIFELYEKIGDRETWFFVLCNALVKSRRKDLSRTIQDIMAKNIF